MNLSLAEIELPIRLRLENPMSDEELLRFCAANEAVRLERNAEGEILVMTPAGFLTSRMNQRIGRFLDAWAEADGRGVATGPDGGYTLPDGSMRAPDAAWVASDRIQSLKVEDLTKFIPLCPDFIIELRSPSDRLSDLQEKMSQWIANGALVAWLIDPEERSVTIYRAGQSPEHLIEPTSVQGDGPITGFELVMDRVWL